MTTKELLFTLTSENIPSGAEALPAHKVAPLLAPWCDTRVDRNGNLIATLRRPEGAPAGEKHLMLDAHLDELGLIVTGITEEGFVQATALGGVDARLLLSSEVMFHGAEEVYGVVGAVPPHLQTPEDRKKPAKLENCYIDTGFTREELEGKLALGDFGTFIGEPTELLNGRVMAKALDNRASCAVLIRAAELLAKDLPPCQVSFVFSAKEETNGAGAKTAAFALQPTHAIAVDVSFATAPGVPEGKNHGSLGDSALVSFAPILSREMSRELMDLAKEHDIPCFAEVMGGGTGTNADNIAVTRDGVRTGVVSVPLRNMHTPVEICEASDIDNIASLLFHYAHRLS